MNTSSRYRICSGSMLPLIKIGDEIFIEKIDSPENELRRFDILLFKEGEKFMCHFFWKYEQTTKFFITKSLVRPKDEDLPLERSQILGRVVNFKISLFLKLYIFVRMLL